VDQRLPAHLEVSGLLRQVQAEGGFATVLHKGEMDSGTILVATRDKSGISTLYERMPSLDGPRKWHIVLTQDIENMAGFQDYLDRRIVQDPDIWIVELDIVNGERFIGIVNRKG
jgi:hypothetical protein